MIEQKTIPQRGLVIHPVSSQRNSRVEELRMQEAVGLSEALGVKVAAQQITPMRDIKVGKYLGSGKIEELASIIKARDINLVVINASLAPIQQRNLEETWNVKVIDRTGLILEIFALRARTKEGRLQVELARLGYERSRLVRTWTHLERQRGGQGFLAGPGETQIESDRRMLLEKIDKLKGDLEQVRRTRALQRRKRKRAPERVVALVGYTNTGKSTLFNLLTGSGVLAKNMLFATLDTTHRVLILPSGQKAVLSDTVGFISDLPTDLVDAFRATLEEVKEADLLIHVRDISDPLTEERKQDVMQILGSIEAGPKYDQSMIEVWNKTDLLGADERAGVGASEDSEVNTFAISCLNNEGIDALRDGIEKTLSRFDHHIDVTIVPKDMHIRAWLHENGEVLTEKVNELGHTHIHARLPQVNADMLRSRHPQIFL